MKLGAAIDRVRKNIKKLNLIRQPECYSVSEAVYLLAGGKKSGLKVMRIKPKTKPCKEPNKIKCEEECCSHWFLKGPYGEIIDLTAGQFESENGIYLPDYNKAIGAGFYPNASNIAKSLMK